MNLQYLLEFLLSFKFLLSKYSKILNIPTLTLSEERPQRHFFSSLDTLQVAHRSLQPKPCSSKQLRVLSPTNSDHMK